MCITARNSTQAAARTAPPSGLGSRIGRPILQGGNGSMRGQVGRSAPSAASRCFRTWFCQVLFMCWWCGVRPCGMGCGSPATAVGVLRHCQPSAAPLPHPKRDDPTTVTSSCWRPMGTSRPRFDSHTIYTSNKQKMDIGGRCRKPPLGAYRGDSATRGRGIIDRPSFGIPLFKVNLSARSKASSSFAACSRTTSSSAADRASARLRLAFAIRRREAASNAALSSIATVLRS